MFGMFVYLSRRTVLHQFTCLAVARLAVTPVLLSCHRAKLRRLMRPSSVVLKLFYEKLTTEAAHTCLWLHSGFKPGPWIVMTLSLNSLHVLSLLSVFKSQGGRFLYWRPWITFPSCHHVWLARQNVLQTACTQNKSTKPSNSSRNNTWEI